MKNGLDEQYIDLLKDILENGIEKNTRNGKVLSVFGRTMRYKFKDGKFPLLTTKKIAWKTMVVELLWFLKGDTNIKYLVDNDCHIWDGDAYKYYILKEGSKIGEYGVRPILLTKEEFINKIKTDDDFAKTWGELGPIYGKQWRSWEGYPEKWKTQDRYGNWMWQTTESGNTRHIDQIANLINDLKTNPDSRRLMVSAWNPADLPHQVLPPCHYGFQVYTREMSVQERQKYDNHFDSLIGEYPDHHITLDKRGVPRRAISLMFNMRSCDTFLGLPFNIASYGLLLMMIADEVNMVSDELIGNLGDTHLYLNHIEQAKEQIGRELTTEERVMYYETTLGRLHFIPPTIDILDKENIPTRTREPFPLPTVHVRDGIFCSSVNDVILENYQSHPTIKAPLSN
jgi:thymidylate synthase